MRATTETMIMMMMMLINSESNYVLVRWLGVLVVILDKLYA